MFDSSDGMHAILGSPYYVAPEVLLATKPTPSDTGLVLPTPEAGLYPDPYSPYKGISFIRNHRILGPCS